MALDELTDTAADPSAISPEPLSPPTPSRPWINDLPPEILLDIFRAATEIPGSLSLFPTEIFDPAFAVYTTADFATMNGPTVVRSTKSAILRVSRAWRTVGIQLLFEHLVIGGPLKARSILAALENSRRPDGLSEYGQWTRRIDVYTHSRNCETFAYLRTLLKIFRCCSYVTTLHCSWAYHPPRAWTEQLRLLFGDSLRRIHWHHCKPLKDEDTHVVDLSKSFLQFQNLTMLDMASFEFARRVGSNSSGDSKGPALHLIDESVELTALTRLRIGCLPRQLTIATQWRLPALNTVIFIDPKSSIAMDVFLQAHGRRLTAIHIEPVYHVLAPEASRTGFDLTPVLQCCISLLDLSFGAYDCRPLSKLGEPHAHISRIGIWGCDEWPLPVRSVGIPRHSKDKDNDRFPQHLRTFTTDNFPNLDIVRMLGCRDWGYTLYKGGNILDRFIKWTKRFEREDIQLQDADGRVWFKVPGETPVDDADIDDDASIRDNDVDGTAQLVPVVPQESPQSVNAS